MLGPRDAVEPSGVIAYYAHQLCNISRALGYCCSRATLHSRLTNINWTNFGQTELGGCSS